MLLEKLSSEVVDMIVYWCLSPSIKFRRVTTRLERDLKTGLNLALTCRALCKMARPHIFKKIALNWAPSTRSNLLERTLEHEPIYGHFTRSLTVMFARRRWDDTYHPTMKSKRHILAPFPNTRKLRTNIDLDDIVTASSGKMKSNLTKIVHINQGWASNSELNAFIASFPRLDHLTITPGTVNFRGFTPENRNANLSIQELVFSWWSKIDVLALQDTLSCCPRLKLLSCGLPLKPDQLDFRHDDATYEVSPASIQTMLGPVAKDLINLSLSAIGQNRLQYDGTLLDLSNFPSLKKLRISLSLFMSLDTPAASGVYRLLPKSLEGLQIDLNFDQVKGILDKTLSVDWILEFAQNKDICFPLLRKIKFLGQYDSPETIDKSESLQEVFSALEPADIVGTFSCWHIKYPGQEKFSQV